MISSLFVLILLSTCPDDPAVQRAKQEQSESVQHLKKTGEREFDFPVHWLPVDDGGDGGAGADGGGDTDVGDGCGGHMAGETKLIPPRRTVRRKLDSANWVGLMLQGDRRTIEAL